MDSSISNPSQYLQDRLRDRKAEATSHHLPRHSTGGQDRPLNSGRDDAIFDVDDSPPSKSTQPTFYSSPMAYSNNNVTRRRTAGSRASSGAVSKAMGARELDEHLDKLSKQNFDLKLEVYHRREKCEELERRVKDVERLEDDNLELREINEELFAELENRDQAVDEAVVMITDLEAKVKLLEEQLAEVRASAVEPAKARLPSEVLSLRNQLEQPRPQRPLVSTNVSSKMFDLASPAKSEPNRHIPSFIENPEPGTGALRSLFVHNEKQIRAIPSYASLLSKHTAREDDDEAVGEPRSPQLSVLSERDLGSVYGHDMLDEKPEPALDQQRGALAQPVESSAEYKDRKVERTTNWVANSDAPPPKIQVNPQRVTRTDSGHFQSLGGVLHQPAPMTESPTKPRKKQPQVGQFPENKSTPPLGIPPMYRNNAFPPTPDTMNTHSLNRSSSSIIRDKSINDSTSIPEGNYTSLLQVNSMQQLSTSASLANISARNSLLPKEFEAYGDSDDENDMTAQMMNEFGISLYQTYSSEDGISNYETPMTHRHASSVGARPHVSPSNPADFSPRRINASPPRVFQSRRRSFDGQLEPHALSASGAVPRGGSELPGQLTASPPRRGSVDILNKQRALRMDQDRHSDKATYDNASLLGQREVTMSAQKATPRHSRPLPPAPPSSAPSPAKTVASPSRSTSRPRRAESLRQRLSRFARRNSQSSAPSVPSIPVLDGPGASNDPQTNRTMQTNALTGQGSNTARPSTSDTGSRQGTSTHGREVAGYMSSTGVTYGTNGAPTFVRSPGSSQSGGERSDRGRVLERPVGGVFSTLSTTGSAQQAHRRGDGSSVASLWPASRVEGAGRYFDVLDRSRKIYSPTWTGSDGQSDTPISPATSSNDRRPRTAKGRRGSEGTVPLYI